MMTTSGRSSRVMRMPCSAVSAVPTTAICGSSRSKRTMLSRIISWSSMTTTRIPASSLIAIEHVAYTFEQNRLVERLLEQQEICSKDSFCLENGLGVAGHEEDSYVGPHLPHLVRDGRTLHFRHDHVGQKEIDGPNVGRRNLYRLSSARCGEDVVTVASEHPSRDFAQSVLIVDHKDRLGSRREDEVICVRIGLVDPG